MASLRRLGLINWIFCKGAARVLKVPEVHLFTTLGQHKRLFWTWLPFAGTLLGGGKLPRHDTEMAILRVGHLRNCQYELQQHSRIAQRYGFNETLLAMVSVGASAAGLTPKMQVLLAATDELVLQRTWSTETVDSLLCYYDRVQLIELCTLIGQYDALAATISALEVPLDYLE